MSARVIVVHCCEMRGSMQTVHTRHHRRRHVAHVRTRQSFQLLDNTRKRTQSRAEDRFYFAKREGRQLALALVERLGDVGLSV